MRRRQSELGLAAPKELRYFSQNGCTPEAQSQSWPHCMPRPSGGWLLRLILPRPVLDIPRPWPVIKTACIAVATHGAERRAYPARDRGVGMRKSGVTVDRWGGLR